MPSASSTAIYEDTPPTATGREFPAVCATSFPWRKRSPPPNLQDAYDRMHNGERVTGPAAKRYTEGIQLYNNKFGGRYLTNRQAAALRSNPKLRIYDNGDQFVTCCYDQTKALCHPDRRAANGIEQTPDVTNCKPNCGNIARTDTNIARAETAVSLHRSEIDDPATPLPMRARLQQRVIALQSIIDQHRRTGVNE